MPDNETLHRVRRIETRLTQLLVGMGFDTHAQKPRFESSDGDDPVLHLPSPHTSFKELVSAIPDGWVGAQIRMCVGDTTVGWFIAP